MRFEKKSGRDLKELMGLLGGPGARNTGVASPPCLITFLISRQMGSCHIHDTLYTFTLNIENQYMNIYYKEYNNSHKSFELPKKHPGRISRALMGPIGRPGGSQP